MITEIIEIPKPGDKEAIERFLGLVGYVSKFIPNEADLRQSLKDLTHMDM